MSNTARSHSRLPIKAATTAHSREETSKGKQAERAVAAQVSHRHSKDTLLARGIQNWSPLPPQARHLCVC